MAVEPKTASASGHCEKFLQVLGCFIAYIDYTIATTVDNSNNNIVLGITHNSYLGECSYVYLFFMCI